MINPYLLDELVRIRQHELLKEAEHRRLVSEAMAEKSGKMGIIRWFITGVGKLGVDRRRKPDERKLISGVA